MPFTLNVDISGLCVFLFRSGDAHRVTVLMPDRRSKGRGAPTPQGAPAPHVGYLRYSLDNLVTGVRGLGASPADAPSYEVVHLFDREQMLFGLDDEGDDVDTRLFNIPNFDEFAPEVRPIDGLLDKNPPEPVLMRAVLTGGSLTSVLDGARWALTADATASPQQGQQFGGQTLWRREVRGSGLTLRVARFDGSGVVEIPLVPTAVGGAMQITLKLANLCATNPLEWDTLAVRTVNGPDEDFKQLYSLYEHRDGGTVVPKRPVPIAGTFSKEGDLQDCFGARGTA